MKATHLQTSLPAPRLLRNQIQCPLHQHHTDRLIYRYPLVQYKIIDGTPTVIGINEGAEVLKEIYDQYNEINLGGNIYEIMERG
ncbi:MAG: hypothetical protein MIO93_00095, partial [ANME-2 cluster archaeon]|nr:hypothetical protein [ANME-2 cluster archaeon]